MPADPPPSLLITPDMRRRLQQRYEESQRLAAQPRPPFRRVHELLAACVQADPGNILYVDALLANLRRREASGWSRSWLARWVKHWLRPRGPDEYAVPGSQHAVLSDAAKYLWDRPHDPSLLRTLAEAAAACDFEEIELRYLNAARESSSDDVETLRMLARALTRQGRFEDAVGPWFAVLALASSDAEAERAIEDLRGAVQSVGHSAIQAHVPRSDNADSLVHQARAMQDAGKFSEAEEFFAHAQAALGGDLRLLEEREMFRLRRSEDRLAIARRRAASDSHPRAQSLVRRMEQEHLRLEIEVLNIRAERLTTDWALRVELARRLKRSGNSSGAIQRLEESLKLQPHEPTVLIELGECWQHLRQFPKALDFYRQAIAGCEQIGSETLNLARYRAAVLAAAMERNEEARQHLAAIVASEPGFKDARERLDKLREN